MNAVNVALGTRYTDVATGFVGVATAVAYYLGDEVKVQLTRIGKEDKPVELWFAWGRLTAAEGELPGNQHMTLCAHLRPVVDALHGTDTHTDYLLCRCGLWHWDGNVWTLEPHLAPVDIVAARASGLVGAHRDSGEVPDSAPARDW